MILTVTAVWLAVSAHLENFLTGQWPVITSLNWSYSYIFIYIEYYIIYYYTTRYKIIFNTMRREIAPHCIRQKWYDMTRPLVALKCTGYNKEVNTSLQRSEYDMTRGNSPLVTSWGGKEGAALLVTSKWIVNMARKGQSVTFCYVYPCLQSCACAPHMFSCYLHHELF